MGYQVQGEVRGIKDRTFSYTDKNGAPAQGREVAVTVEMAGGEYVEVKFSREQIAAQLPASFAQLKGRTMVLPVEVYVKKGYLNVLLSSSFAFPAAAPASASKPAA